MGTLFLEVLLCTNFQAVFTFLHNSSHRVKQVGGVNGVRVQAYKVLEQPRTEVPYHLNPNPLKPKP